MGSVPDFFKSPYDDHVRPQVEDPTMPIHFVSSYLSGLINLDVLPTILASFVAVFFLKQWSGGADLAAQLDREADKAERQGKDGIGKNVKIRDLHGTVMLVVGGFTSQGLLVCAQLSSLGAQLVLLTPTLRSSHIVQMVHLLRDGTSNPLIYAEECDITNLASIEAFAAKWNLGEGSGSGMGGLGAGPAGGLSASTGVGATSRPGGTPGKGETGKGGGGSAPRRIDSIVFLPLDSSRHSVGSAPRLNAEGVEIGHAEILGRFHLVNVLLPSLLLLPPNRDVRIISLTSPWYAAGIASFDAQDLDLTQTAGKAGQSFPSWSPWQLDGAQTLLWLSLSRELQRRIQLMTDADQRPRTKLPGIDDEGNVIGKTATTNVNIINVCVGFERGRDIVDYILPEQTSFPDTVEDLEEISGRNNESAEKDTSVATAGADIKRLIDPRKAQPSSKKQKKQSKAHENLAREVKSAARQSGLLFTLLSFVRYLIAFLIWPLAWLLCKTPRRAAESVIWATVVPVQSNRTLERSLGLSNVMPGELHREGRVVRPPLPRALLPGPPVERIWQNVEAEAQSILSDSKVRPFP